jgi:hypothetical protein
MSERVRLLPDPDQRRVLSDTLERVNRVSNAVRSAALGAPGPADVKAVRGLVQAESERQKLPAAYNKPIAERVTTELRKLRGGGKFSTYQSVTLPPTAVKWPGTDRVNLPTVAGRRTIPVFVDRTRGDLRPPLEGRPASLVFANGEFDLVAEEPARAGSV